MNCSRCDKHVDTDIHEMYEDTNGDAICESCADELEAKTDLENDALSGK